MEPVVVVGEDDPVLEDFGVEHQAEDDEEDNEFEPGGSFGEEAVEADGANEEEGDEHAEQETAGGEIGVFA